MSRTVLMGPAKGSRTIHKTIVKGYEDQQQHDDPSSSSKAKQKKKKISDLDPKWSKDELTNFYKAYRQHGKDWKKVSIVVGGKSPDMVRSLYTKHRAVLSLPERKANAMGFIAVVTDHHNASEKTTSHRRYDHIVRASGKARKQQKSIDGPDPHNYHEGKISGFSAPFKKRYYGELVRKSRNHAVRRRTPRIPVIAPADRSTIDEATPGIENVINSTKRKYEAANNDCAIVPRNEYSPDRLFGFAEANKAGQDHSFFATKGTGDSAICQQHFKKTRIQQTLKEGLIGIVEHETKMASKERDKLVDSLDNNQILIDSISEDDMLVLDVLNSLVNAPSKMSKLEINIPSGSLGKTDSALSHRREEEHPNIDLSKQGKKPVGKSSASLNSRKKKHKKILGAEVPAEAQNICGNNLVLPERVGIIDDSSLCTDSGRVGMPETSEDISAEVPNAQTKTKPEVRMPARTRPRKSQMHCKRKHMSCSEGSDKLQAKKLLHCLSSEPLRRWCTYEWFYSAVDYPWFSNNEFKHYLEHAKLSHLKRLTRSEWSAIRSSLGKPRRFSNHFLSVEKEKLEDYREKVRKIYAQLSDGSRDSLPADLARPFSIGQQVIVRHPSSRELCDGKVVMIWPDCYKVHFDDPDLGVDIVKDTDCMAVNWLYNRLDNMRRSYLSNNAYSIMEMDHVPYLTPSENGDHAVNGATVLEGLQRLRLTSDIQPKAESIANSERPPYRSTSDDSKSWPCSLELISQNQTAIQQYFSLTTNQHDAELESYVAAFVESSLSQARQMVDEAMQANSGGSDDEKVCMSNRATGCVGPGSESAHGAQLPSNLISNCIATVLSIKRLSDSRHPLANVLGVMEHASSMLRPSCPENLRVYKDIQRELGIILGQLFARVPTTLGNYIPPVSPM